MREDFYDVNYVQDISFEDAQDNDGFWCDVDRIVDWGAELKAFEDNLKGKIEKLIEVINRVNKKKIEADQIASEEEILRIWGLEKPKKSAKKTKKIQGEGDTFFKLIREFDDERNRAWMSLPPYERFENIEDLRREKGKRWAKFFSAHTL
jgi:hypothetical protein